MFKQPCQIESRHQRLNIWHKNEHNNHNAARASRRPRQDAARLILDPRTQQQCLGRQKASIYRPTSDCRRCVCISHVSRASNAENRPKIVHGSTTSPKPPTKAVRHIGILPGRWATPRAGRLKDEESVLGQRIRPWTSRLIHLEIELRAASDTYVFEKTKEES